MAFHIAYLHRLLDIARTHTLLQALLVLLVTQLFVQLVDLFNRLPEKLFANRKAPDVFHVFCF